MSLHIKNKSFLFLGKRGDSHCESALNYLKLTNNNIKSYLGDWGDSFPDEIYDWSGDYIISYLSRWIVPEEVLKSAKIAAINFHPASPSYPGIGCNNFALYDNASEFGVTCHHMEPTVDTGDIIATKLFPVFEQDTVETLMNRTADYQLVLFYEAMSYILMNKALPKTAIKWTRKPYTRKNLEDLAVITLDMDIQEIQRRVRATTYREHQPNIKIGDLIFKFSENRFLAAENFQRSYLRKNIIIFGAGGHAKVIIDLIEASNIFTIIGIMDNKLSKGSVFCGYPILGLDESLPVILDNFSVFGGLVAIGDNASRQSVVSRILAIVPEFRFVNIIHPSAIISKSVKMGLGNVIMPGAVINTSTEIHNHTIINTSVSVDHDCRVGDFVSLCPSVTLAGNVVIKDHCFLGMCASIAPNCTVGSHSIIGAGSIVLNDVPSQVKSFGIPSRVYDKVK